MRTRGILFCAAILLAADPSPAVTYLGYNQWGGGWSDAEKSPVSAEDDNMCWAAAAANVLDWTGWGQMAGYTDADGIFGCFQDHWTDAGGMMQFAWSWWFDGADASRRQDGWSYVDVPGGGFVDELYDFTDYYHRTSANALAMSAIDEYLRSGYGVAVIVSKRGRSHTLTSWGYDYGEDGYSGIWVTDSDDDRGLTSPPDSLDYLAVSSEGGRWHLLDYRGTDGWYINEVQALDRVPGASPAAVPEPVAVTLLALGGVALLRRRRG